MIRNPDSGVLSNKVVRLIILNFAKDIIFSAGQMLSALQLLQLLKQETTCSQARRAKRFVCTLTSLPLN